MSTSDTYDDPTLGPWNTLQCRTNTHLIFPLGEQNANGVVVAVNIFPISGGTYPQAIFALRNNVNFALTLTFELASDLRLKIWQNSPGWNLRVDTATTLTNGNS